MNTLSVAQLQKSIAAKGALRVAQRPFKSWSGPALQLRGGLKSLLQPFSTTTLNPIFPPANMPPPPRCPPRGFPANMPPLTRRGVHCGGGCAGRAMREGKRVATLKVEA